MKKGVHLPPSLTHLIFHHSFYSPVSINPSSKNHFLLPTSLTHLAFGAEFNPQIEILPPNLTHLSFGEYFNRPLKNLPSTLTHLLFGDQFEKLLHPVPINLLYLKCGSSFNQPLEISSCTKLTHLIFGYRFNQPLLYIPSSLTHLHFGTMFAQPLNYIPPKLVYLFLKRNYTFPLPIIPSSLCYLRLESYDIDFLPPAQVTELVWKNSEEYNFSHFPNLTWLSITTPLSLDEYPPNITHLTIRTLHIREYSLPPTVTHFDCHSVYLTCVLPPTLIFLQARRVSSKLPPSLINLRLIEYLMNDFAHPPM